MKLSKCGSCAGAFKVHESRKGSVSTLVPRASASRVARATRGSGAAGVRRRRASRASFVRSSAPFRVRRASSAAVTPEAFVPRPNPKPKRHAASTCSRRARPSSTRRRATDCAARTIALDRRRKRAPPRPTGTTSTTTGPVLRSPDHHVVEACVRELSPHKIPLSIPTWVRVAVSRVLETKHFIHSRLYKRVK